MVHIYHISRLYTYSNKYSDDVNILMIYSRDKIFCSYLPQRAQSVINTRTDEHSFQSNFLPTFHLIPARALYIPQN